MEFSLGLSVAHCRREQYAESEQDVIICNNTSLPNLEVSC